ncbi:MAG: leucine-rich repeat protein, partial [Prevotellaceae bacterium]|nr:leucine-rich repeat protein [Prevotellaceae bacterium]
RTGITEITISEDIAALGNAFVGCSGLTTLNYNAINCTPGNSWLSGCTSLTNLNIGNSVQIIPDNFVSGCSSLTTLTIGNAVTSIGNYAFQNCSSLTSVTIPNSVTSIGERAFQNCSSLTTITIPDSVTSIGNYAFSGCSSLTTLTIGNSVTSIGKYAFQNCSSLTDITSESSTPPTVPRNAFTGVPDNYVINIPNCSYDDYKAQNNGWFYFFYFRIVSGICMVSVDENNHNQIVVDNFYSNVFLSVNIYKEGAVSEQYDSIANIDLSVSNVFTDVESNASVRSYRYMACGVMDECGSTTYYATNDAHKTMHLTINAGQNNSWNLIWTPYTGASFSTYNILRSTVAGGEMMQIGTMPAGNTSFTDFSAPAGNVYYVVEIVLNDACPVIGASPAPSPQHAPAAPVASIRSNVATNSTSSGIEDMQVQQLVIYPNPVKDELIISNEQLTANNVQIYDIAGKVVNYRLLSANSIDVSNLPNGIYFIKVGNASGRFVKE